MLVRYTLLSLLLVVLNSAQGMNQAVQKFESLYKKPFWDPLEHKKHLYEEANKYHKQGDMKRYYQLLQEAAERVSYRAYNGPTCEVRTTGYFKAQYALARFWHKEGNLPQATFLYGKSLRHSRFSTEEKAKETYVLSVERLEEILKNNPDNGDALVLLARECLMGRDQEVIERGFEYLERIENSVGQEERFELFKKYGWSSVVSRMDYLEHEKFAHRRGFILFHIGQLKQHGICGEQKKAVASCYYAEALRIVQPNDIYKIKAEQNLRHLAFDQKTNLCSVSEYMEYVKSQKQWESYCTIGSSILDNCDQVLGAVYKEIQARPGNTFRVIDSKTLSIEYFDKSYPGLFVADSEIDDSVSDELRFKLLMLKVRYLMLKAKEYRVNDQKNSLKDVIPAYEAVLKGYKDLAALSKQKYVKYKFDEQHRDICCVAGMYAASLFTSNTNPYAMEAAMKFYLEAYRLGEPRGSCTYALIGLTAEVTLDERRAKSYLSILETNILKLEEPGEVYKQMYQLFSGENAIRSNVNIKNAIKAKECAQKGAKAGNDFCTFKYGLLLLKDKDAKKHAEGNELINKAAQNELPQANVWLKLKEIHDDVMRANSDGASATESLRKFIHATDYETVIDLESHELFKAIQEAVTKKNKVLGNIIKVTVMQRLKAEQNKMNKVVRVAPVNPIFTNN